MAVATRAVSFDDEAGRSFEEEWPELARRLERFLAGKGVETWLLRDVVQETATRVYRKWTRLDRSRPLWNLVVTIALGILVDERRRAARMELVPEVPRPAIDDVENRALHRVYLLRTRAALEQLSADQRRVLLAEIGEAAALDGPRNPVNVFRSRARAKLREALGPWAPSGITIKLRDLLARTAQRKSAVETHIPAMASALVNIAIAATLALAGAAVEPANAAASVSGFVQPERARLESSAKVRGAGLDPTASIRHPESPRLSRAKDRAPEEARGVPYVVANTRENAERLAELAQDRAEYTKERADYQAEHKKEWAEDRAEHTKDRAEDRAEHNKEWAEDKLP